MAWTIDGKRVLVTGGNAGIGRATAEELARRGASVIITARDPGKGRAAAEEIRSATGAEVEVETVDLASFDAIRELADRVIAANDRLDVLINNAGTIAPKGRSTAGGLDWTFAVNHLGPFLLTQLLTDLLVASRPSRIINVSSEAHRSAQLPARFDELAKPADRAPTLAYASSKLANILHTIELDRRLGPEGVLARALHPGVVRTNFGRGADGVWWLGAAMRLFGPFFRKPSEGAATSVHLASADEADLQGSLYWADARPKEPLAAGVEPPAAELLWTLSEELTMETEQ